MQHTDTSRPPFTDPRDDDALIAWFEGVAARHAGTPDAEFSYGSSDEQTIEVWSAHRRPGASPRGAVVSIHGGAFMAEFDKTIHHPFSKRLRAAGYDVYNIEYRRTGSARAPEATIADVRLAVSTIHERDDRPLAVMGHSVGGFLAEWVSTEAGVDLVLPLAPVTDLARWGSEADPDGCLDAWLQPALGEKDADVDGLCRQLSPDPLRRAGAPRVFIHGTEDLVVPVQHSRVYVEQTSGGATLTELEGEGHYAFMDPDSGPFEVVLEHLDSWASAL